MLPKSFTIEFLMKTFFVGGNLLRTRFTSVLFEFELLSKLKGQTKILVNIWTDFFWIKKIFFFSFKILIVFMFVT